MSIKVLTYSLTGIFLLPLLPLLPTRTDLEDLFFDAVVVVLLVVIPLIGLWSKRIWFFYYVYIIAVLSLVFIIISFWFLSLFGDQNNILLEILALWPIDLYFGAAIAMTAMLQKRRNAAEIGTAV
jgi:hypothetical protein